MAQEPADRALRERRLERYVEVLLAANRRVNLTAARDPAAARALHVADSLLAMPLLADLPAGARIADVGSGGGAPGIPLAIARPDLHVTLVESLARKARALEGFVVELALGNVRVACARAETLARDPAHRERYAAALCRAVGPLAEVAELALPLLAVGGFLLAFKGSDALAECDAARGAIARLGGAAPGIVVPAGANPRDTRFVRIVKERATPADLPRAPGRARKSPLT